MERSKPLHNFSLPPGLTWGRQRFLRCMNVYPIRSMPALDDYVSSDSEDYKENRSTVNRRAEVEEVARTPGGRSSDDRRIKRVRFILKPLSPSPSPAPKIGSIRKPTPEDEEEISVTRQKLVVDFQTEVCKLKKAILENYTTPDDEIAPSKVSPSSKANSPPLNSKTMQNSVKQHNTPPPDAICEGGDKGVINAAVHDPTCEKKSMRPKRNLEKKEERAKFSISLSRKEIEDDFISMTGKKPPRKPKKRPKNVQNALQGIYPGSLLSEVHPDRYKKKKNGSCVIDVCWCF